MRRDILLLFAAAVAIALVVAPALDPALARASTNDPDPDPVPAEYTIYGFISNISDQEKNVPLQGVSVSLLDSGKSPVIDPSTGAAMTCVTDENGMFRFTYPSSSGATCLHFDYPGYTVRAAGDLRQTSDDNNTLSFSLTNLVPDAEGDHAGEYRLTGDGDSTSAVGMAITKGALFGTVRIEGSGEAVVGATVYATSSNGRVFSTTTREDGSFDMTVPYGSYSVTVSCSGFQSSDPIEVSTGDQSSLDVELVENEFGIDIFGGIDMPHAMMIFGLILIGLVLLFSLGIIHKSREGESSIVIVDDLDLDEDEEVRNP